MQIFYLLKVGGVISFYSHLQSELKIFFSQGVQSRVFKIFLASQEKIFNKNQEKKN